VLTGLLEDDFGKAMAKVIGVAVELDAGDSRRLSPLHVDRLCSEGRHRGVEIVDGERSRTGSGPDIQDPYAMFRER
jgi:hypothetical protein